MKIFERCISFQYLVRERFHIAYENFLLFHFSLAGGLFVFTFTNDMFVCEVFIFFFFLQGNPFFLMHDNLLIC